MPPADPHRVRRARVDLRVGPGLDAAGARTLVVERALPALVEALGAEVARRLGPDALVCVRALRLDWELDLADAADLEGAVAPEARRIADALLHGAAEPDPAAAVAVFRSPAHRALEATVRRRGGVVPWYDPTPPAEEPIVAFVAGDPARAEAVLAELARVDPEGRVFEAPAVADALMAALPRGRWPLDAAASWLRRAPRRGSAGTTSADAPRALAPTTSLPGAAPTAARASGATPMAPGQPAADAPASAARAGGDRPTASEASNVDALARPEAPAHRPDAEASAAPARLRGAEAVTLPAPGLPGASAGAPRPDTPGAASPPVADMAHAHVATDPAADAPTGAPVDAALVRTHAGGLVYLLGVAVRAELPEALWAAGFREGHVLAHVLASLAGAVDPLALALGGVARLPVLAEPEAWAADEVLARLPAPPEGLTDLRPATPLGPKAGAFVVALAARLAGRFLADAGWAPERLGAALGVAGWLDDQGERLLVLLPMASVDLDLRRAGLDRDPGWAAWLRKDVRIVYEPGPEDEL